MAKSCKWVGKSGTGYIYNIHPIDANWNDVPGNYIFAREASPHIWQAVYIGETDSLKNTLSNHEAWPCIHRNRGTHVHTHVNLDSEARLAEEADLVANQKPPCNR